MEHSSKYYVRRICSFLILFTVTFSTALFVHAKSRGHAPWVGETLKGAPCLGGSENFGPFDYLQRHQLKSKLGIVEKHHFTPQVEQLIGGANTGNKRDVLADLDYTLRAWPNHHRALNSTIQFHIINKNWKTHFPPAECYLERAINFSPKDGITRMLYGNLLQRNGKQSVALKQYEKALELKPKSVQIKYNLALLLVELGNYKRARKYALDLYPNGFPLPGLKDKLKKVGHWSKEDNVKKNNIEKAESSGVSEVQ